MNATYARGGADDTRAGKIILVVTSSLAALLVISGLIYATGTSQRSAAAAAAAGCEPGLTSEGHPCITQPMLASEYMAILTPATQQQNVDMAAYIAGEGDHLAAAETALTAEVASERAFDASLAGIEFPSVITPIAQALIRANQARANLIAKQARSTSLKRLRSFNHRVQAASAAVQTEMNLILKAIDAPPQAD
jgi:hypothetical protein